MIISGYNSRGKKQHRPWKFLDRYQNPLQNLVLWWPFMTATPESRALQLLKRNSFFQVVLYQLTAHRPLCFVAPFKQAICCAFGECVRNSKVYSIGRRRQFFQRLKPKMSKMGAYSTVGWQKTVLNKSVSLVGTTIPPFEDRRWSR